MSVRRLYFPTSVYSSSLREGQGFLIPDLLSLIFHSFTGWLLAAGLAWNVWKYSTW